MPQKFATPQYVCTAGSGMGRDAGWLAGQSRDQLGRVRHQGVDDLLIGQDRLGRFRRLLDVLGRPRQSDTAELEPVLALLRGELEFALGALQQLPYLLLGGVGAGELAGFRHVDEGAGDHLGDGAGAVGHDPAVDDGDSLGGLFLCQGDAPTRVCHDVSLSVLVGWSDVVNTIVT